jgi:hypothetical protein
MLNYKDPLPSPQYRANKTSNTKGKYQFSVSYRGQNRIEAEINKIIPEQCQCVR